LEPTKLLIVQGFVTIWIVQLASKKSSSAVIKIAGFLLKLDFGKAYDNTVRDYVLKP